MPSTTPNYNLALYDSTTDLTQLFSDYRAAISGTASTSNMMLIDSALNLLQAQILSNPSGVTYINSVAGGTNAYAITGVDSITAYAVGIPIILTVDIANTGSATLDINLLGIKYLKKVDSTGTASYLSSGDLIPNRLYPFVYNGTDWIIIANILPSQIAEIIHGSTGKTTPVNLDEFVISDSEDSYTNKKLTFINLKTGLNLIDGTGVVGQVAEFVTNTKTLQAAKIIGPATNILTITNSAASTLGLNITSGKTLTLISIDNYTLTVPATGTVALLGTSNVFTSPQTITSTLLIDGTSSSTQPVKIFPIYNGGTNGAEGVRMGATFNPSANVSSLYGTVFQATINASTYNVTNLNGFFVRVSIGATYTGTAPDLFGINIANPTISVGGTSPGNVYGLYINNQTLGGTLNYAIYTNSGLNRLGDQLSIVGSSDKIQFIVKSYSSQTTNLQEWQNSGGTPLASINGAGVILPVQAVTGSAPTYVKGGIYFDTTLNKLRVGGATAWETITSV